MGNGKEPCRWESRWVYFKKRLLALLQTEANVFLNYIHTTAYLYKDFNVQADFEAAEKYARDLDVLLWSNSKQRKMVIAQE